MVWSQGAALYTKAVGWGLPEPYVDAACPCAAPVVAMDANGNAVAVWSEDNDVLATRYDVGSGWSQATVIDNYSGDAYASDIAIDADGNATAVWFQHVTLNRTAIFANRYSVGQGWGSAQRIELSPDTGSSQPKCRRPLPMVDRIHLRPRRDSRSIA